MTRNAHTSLHDSLAPGYRGKVFEDNNAPSPGATKPEQRHRGRQCPGATAAAAPRETFKCMTGGGSPLISRGNS